jgi:hypothetical protein
VVIPAIRKDGAYIMGEEKLRTGEMSPDELMARGYIAAMAKIEDLKTRNAVLEHARAFLTVDAYLAEKGHFGQYKSQVEKSIIGGCATRLAKARGIPLQKQHRTMRTGWGGIRETPVNVYPRELLDEACTILGYIPRVVEMAPERGRHLVPTPGGPRLQLVQ